MPGHSRKRVPAPPWAFVPVRLAAAVAVAAALLAPTSADAQAVGETKAQTKAQTKARTEPAAKAQKLDLNHATAEEMVDALPGVGEATARKIIAGRPYKTVDDLAKVGVAERTIDSIRTMVTATSPEEKTKERAREKAREKGADKEGKARPAGGKVDLNSATTEELETLPGVGPAYAREIVTARPLKSVDDLEKLKGFGKAKVDALRELAVVEPLRPAARPAAAPAATAPGEPAAVGKTPAKGKAARPAAKAGAAKLVNINTADKAELDALPGIGPVKAQAIIETRPFKAREDVMKVKGIKEGEYAKIKDLITVD